MRKAFFLDRDGVINENRTDYVKSPEEFVFLPNVGEAIRLLNEAGWYVVVVTNQSMVGRGIATEGSFHAISEKMKKGLAEQGAKVDAIYYCPNKPEDNSPCRKPKPGMLIQAAKELEIDLASSVMVGDMPTDIEAGVRAGTGRQALVRPNRDLLAVVKEMLGL